MKLIMTSAKGAVEIIKGKRHIWIFTGTDSLSSVSDVSGFSRSLLAGDFSKLI